MKKIKLFLCVALFGAMSFGAFSAYDYLTMSEEEKFLLANIEALTTDEPGGSGSTILKLKKVRCQCISTGKKGYSLKCKEYGDLERCTSTQQGSNACYTITLSLLCEGSDAKEI